MSYIAKTAFEARITNGRTDDLANITGMYQESSSAADCSAGLLCVRTSQLPCEGFASVYNENAWYMEAAASTATKNIYACNPYDTPLAEVKNNLYEIGHETLGLGVPAGRYGTFTRINFDGESVYRFGIGNVSGASLASTVTHLTIADGLLVGATSAPSAGVYFEIRGTGNFIEGSSDSYGYVDAVACEA